MKEYIYRSGIKVTRGYVTSSHKMWGEHRGEVMVALLCNLAMFVHIEFLTIT